MNRYLRIIAYRKPIAAAMAIDAIGFAFIVDSRLSCVVWICLLAAFETVAARFCSCATDNHLLGFMLPSQGAQARASLSAAPTPAETNRLGTAMALFGQKLRWRHCADFWLGLELGNGKTVGGERLGANSTSEWLQCVTIASTMSHPDPQGWATN
jgi:hypothetical protein